jgi:hypothetical protein
MQSPRQSTQRKWTPGLAFSSRNAGTLQRKCACGQHTIAGGECSECNKKEQTLQRSRARSHAEGIGALSVPPIVHEVLRSPGQPLDLSTRAFLNPRFGHDFSHVRVHTDSRAAESARAVNAHAYTVGQRVVFAEGQYAPDTPAGQKLLAHEMVHVRQQSSITAPPDHLTATPESDPLERQAAAAEHSISQHESLAPSLTSGPATLSRKPADPLLDTEADTRPEFGGQIADVVEDIRTQREERYRKLADRYRDSLKQKAGIKDKGAIKTPDDALKILGVLNVDIAQLEGFIKKVQTATAKASGQAAQQTNVALDAQVQQAVNQLSEKGKKTFQQAINEVRKEPWFNDVFASTEIFLIPDSAACKRYLGYTQYATSPISGAKHAKRLAALVYLCTTTIESGDVQQVRSVLAHELSHFLEREIAGEGLGHLVTNPLLEELAKKLSELPKFKGFEKALKQFLFEKIGGYPQGEIFAILQALPQDPRSLKDDHLLAVLVCELRRIDAAQLPERIRGALISELRFRTEFFYDQRISESSGSQSRELAKFKRLALLSLDRAIQLRELERAGDPVVKINCGKGF